MISLFLTLLLSFDNILLLLSGSCCTDREFVTEDSDPFFELSAVCQKFLVSNILFITLIKFLASLHVSEYFKCYHCQ